MKRIHHFGVAGALAACLSFVAGSSQATLTNPNAPLYVGVSVAPIVMLDITKDQNLYKKAFSDASDLDGDGVLDTTYKHTIDYFGYFDSYKCYTYSSSNGYYSPVTSSYSEDSSGNPIKPSDCGGNWHGNFLNWASMTRMDAVRKLLYGGYRSTDGTGASGITVLERAYLPTDAHAFAKYYNPDIAGALDPAAISSSAPATYIANNYLAINKLTPFNPTTTPTAVSSSTSITFPTTSTAALSFAVSDTTKFSYGDQVLIEEGSTTSKGYMIGAVSCVNGTGISMYNTINSANTCSAGNIKVVVENIQGSGTSTNWKISNWTQTGLTICNATLGSSTGANQKSQTNTNAPLMRVALGNFSMWAANERWQCYWREESANLNPGENTGSVSGATSTQGNRAALSGIYASSLGPNKTTSSDGRITNAATSGGVTGDFIARVQACVSGGLGQESCELYPSTNYKPNGLLQTYGEAGLLKFGLMTGSYTKNESGGVLRKNPGALSDEINTTTDGTFKTTLPSGGTIISTLNKMRIFGYDYSNGTYNVDSTNGSTFCSWGQQTFSEGTCLSWGNPMSEVFLESLRYLAGKSANTAFNADDSSIISGLTTATWSDPISIANYCAPLNVLVFNASTSSYDANVGGADQMGTVTDLGTTSTAVALTDIIGANEGINGGTWFVGNADGTNGTAICSAKSLSKLSKAVGICPEGPATEGGYLMSGVAYYAHTNRIRNDASFSIPAADTSSLKVNSYGIALASNTPQIKVKIGSKTINIQPALINNLSGSNASGTLVDFEKVCEIPTTASAATVAAIAKKSGGTCAAAGSAAFYINWEDSAQGGDYDQDVWGRLRYQINSNSLTITTDVVAQSTPDLMGFGYSISGTTQDGPHFHSGINSFSYTDPQNITVTGATDINASGGCNGCVVNDAATSVTYSLATTSSNTSLNDPLWYTAKWGGFTGNSTSSTITSVTQWDAKNTDGSTTNCTTSGCDGIPDNYYPVTDPNALETALDQAFKAMLNNSSASSVATNSTSLQSGSQIFQARFNSNFWSGELLAINLNSDGSIGSTAWDAGGQGGSTLDAFDAQTPSSRAIITYGLDTAGGIPFEWSNISGESNAAQKNYLNTNESGTADTKGSQRLGYLRGDLTTNVGTHAGNFRSRYSMLGDIVNSSPTYVGIPQEGWAGSTYKQFVVTNKNRTPMIYVGSNDGMLHGFKISDGTEQIAYVPNEVYPNLSKIPALSYSHRYLVDGTPMVNDIQINVTSGSTTTKTWKTYLVGGLNWGGRAYYALDITDPTQFSEANAASIVKWEFSHSMDGDLGYSFMQPTYPAFKGTADQIALMHNGKWALIAGNGYNSDNGKAALFIIFLDHSGSTWTAGTDYIKLVADNTGPNNGLSTPRPYDFDGDGVVDYVYAGDLQGNLWKFDVTSSNASSWSVAFSGSPLFVAKDASNNRQPITTAPTLTPQINAGSAGGVLVDFGTGQYLQNSDTTSPFATQTLYGIWDSAATATVSGRSVLQQQTVLSSTSTALNSSTSVTNTYRLTSSNTIDWTTKFGWYMDLPSSSTSGERVAYNPILRNDRFVVATLIPSATPCLAGGSSWLMELDALTGARPSSSPFDVNGDGSFSSADYFTDPTSSTSAKIPVSGIMPGQGGIITTPTVVQSQSDPTVEYKYASSSTGAVIVTKEKVSGPQTGRIVWREINQ
ncbi:MAG TPA: PilC/PilY family type IV pilus protein [Burkholderiaceae bacterium]|jgi:type IV pilus assembly protein PilY1